jgi:cold shock CspA family protein
MVGKISRVLRLGYGFLISDGETFFFVSRECYSRFETLKHGDAVAFDVGIGNKKGRRAIRVARLIDLEEPA